MHPLPTEFSERITVQFPSDATQFLGALDEQPAASVRLNAAKPKVLFSDARQVPWNDEGLLLGSRPRYTLDPAFHAGCYYPQESSSMVLQWVLKHTVPADTPIDALDLCAAPGGKSLIIADYLKNNGRLVSNEIIRSRAQILNEVLVKWGSTNVVVTNNRPADIGSGGMLFDLMVVDAPCSGEGMFRKDPDARLEWNSGSAAMCSQRQHEILQDVLPALREEGVLIYSTCTFAPEENENVIASLLATGDFECLRWPIPSEWQVNVVDERGVFAMRFLPHLVPGEGFFIAALRKITPTASARGKSKTVFNAPNSQERACLQQLGIASENVVLAPDGELYKSAFTLPELNTLAVKLYLLQPGVRIGKVLRGELIPAHALALAQVEVLTDAPVQLNAQQAIAYLRGESFGVEAKSGWQRVAFDACVLGWIKVIGNRTNNYYPKEWRVKMKE
jgi:16S rRNA C967 or C1407 C5-methylase (RsmB/RsmF family)/NOL1/NOP2/fmu family ribosome biogenesis protein